MPRIIGLTGNIACGKTSVGQMLLELGAERYIDADALVHQLYEPDQPVTQQIVAQFGPDLLTADGRIDRKRLGNLVFQDAEALRQLERIVHPAVAQTVRREIARASDAGIVILDAVKLLEGGSAALCTSKWLVICPEEQELARLMLRNHLSEQDARLRLAAQPSVAARLPLVDEVIENCGSLAATYQQVKAAFQRFCTAFPV
ncbi:MAG TPA: dephospho-CoA kinase [Ktedonobacteraceae bacterium]|jgi:dephospho-CoA kinase|nr:dephospho-CoA kinase [Ktedonobacteraceae bacterium]